MEIDCFKERKELIKLIQRYKIFLKNIIKKKGIDENKNEVVLKLKKNYEEIQNKLIDKELFNYYLGENFENDCTNVEEITEEIKEEDENNEKKEENDINDKKEENDNNDNENDDENNDDDIDENKDNSIDLEEKNKNDEKTE